MADEEKKPGEPVKVEPKPDAPMKTSEPEQAKQEEKMPFNAEEKFAELEKAMKDLTGRIEMFEEVLDKLEEDEAAEGEPEMAEHEDKEKPEAKETPKEEEKEPPWKAEMAKHAKKLSDLEAKNKDLEESLAKHGVRKIAPSTSAVEDPIANAAQENVKKFMG